MKNIKDLFENINEKAIFLTSPISPSVNHYLSYRAIIKNGKPMAMSYKPAEVVKYRKEFAAYVTDEVKKQGWDLPLDKYQHFYADGIFYLPRIDMDCNNYWKVMLDAITDTQLIWVDDNVVCERVQRIYYDTTNPRIELCIHPVDYIGVFDNASQMDSFISNCIGCARYRRNCSILNDFKMGKISDHSAEQCCARNNEIMNHKEND